MYITLYILFCLVTVFTIGRAWLECIKWMLEDGDAFGLPLMMVLGSCVTFGIVEIGFLVFS